MRTTNATFIAEKNKPENRPIFLYTIFDYDGASSNLYFAEHDENIVFNGVTYQKFPITHDLITEDAQHESSSMKLSISNVSRLIQAYLEQYDMHDKKVVITMVYADHLDDPDAKLEDTFYIDSYTADEEKAEFTLSSKFDVLDVMLPSRKYMRNNCGSKFKSAECGYGGAETTCNKTFARCRQLANQKRFGGFPSIPSQRVFTG